MDPEVPINYPGRVLDQTQADIYGNYTLTIPVTADLVAAATGNGRSLNLSVQAVYSVPGIGDGYLALGGLQARTARLSADQSYWTVHEEEEDSGPLVVEPTQALPLSGGSATASTAETGTCYTTTEIVRTEYPWIVIGEYHTKRDVRGTWAYGRRSDSYLGVGASSDNVNWKISGTVHTGNSYETAVDITRGPNWAHRLRSQFKYVKERTNIYCPGYSNTNHWSIYATRWNWGLDVGADVSGGDTRAAKDAAVSAGNAARFGKNSSASRSDYKAKRYTAGVTVMGVGLSSRSGFSSWVRQNWRFGDNVTYHWLFHPNEHPSTSPVVLSY